MPEIVDFDQPPLLTTLSISTMHSIAHAQAKGRQVTKLHIGTSTL